MTSAWNSSAVLSALQAVGIDVEQNKQMALLTTYAVGGSATLAVTLRTGDDIERAAGALASCGDVPLVVLGRGSNTLFADAGFDGLVVIMASSEESRSIHCDGPVVRAAGSMLMPVLARRSVQAGRAGLEWCVGIPGTVGGAIRMNAGGHGSEMVDSLVRARVVSLRSGLSRDIDVAQCGMHFRGSALSAHHVVVSAEFMTTDSTVEEGTRVLDDIVSWRRQNQPGGRNAGSVFVNPAPGAGSAGALIDAAGLRGFSVGGAQVSDKHANFIQAAEGATAADIVAVMAHVQSVIEDSAGVVLRSEVRLVGFPRDVEERFADTRHDQAEFVAARHTINTVLGEI